MTSGDLTSAQVHSMVLNLTGDEDQAEKAEARFILEQLRQGITPVGGLQ